MKSLWEREICTICRAIIPNTAMFLPFPTYTYNNFEADNFYHNLFKSRLLQSRHDASASGKGLKKKGSHAES